MSSRKHALCPAAMAIIAGKNVIEGPKIHGFYHHFDGETNAIIQTNIPFQITRDQRKKLVQMMAEMSEYVDSDFSLIVQYNAVTNANVFHLVDAWYEGERSSDELAVICNNCDINLCEMQNAPKSEDSGAPEDECEGSVT